MQSFWLGVLSGIPMMIAVGPIAVLLVELGVERGVARAWPAAAGVAVGDLVFAGIAALSGSAVQRVLQPYARPMRWAAATFLLVMAAVMLRRAVAQIAAIRSGAAVGLGEVEVADESRVRLASRFAAFSMTSPMTIGAFTSLAIASGARASTFGWPLGVAAASVAVHGGLVGLGSSLRAALTPMGSSLLRLAGSVMVAGLAANVALR